MSASLIGRLGSSTFRLPLRCRCRSRALNCRISNRSEAVGKIVLLISPSVSLTVEAIRDWSTTTRTSSRATPWTAGWLGGGPEGLIRVPALKAPPGGCPGETAQTTRRPPPSRSPVPATARPGGTLGSRRRGRAGSLRDLEFCDDHHTLAPHAAVCNR